MKWVLLFCLLVSCVPKSESFSATNGYSSQPKPLFESVFAGFFPENPSNKNLPIWKASSEMLKPVVLKVVQGFDIRFSRAHFEEVEDDLDLNSGLRIFEVMDFDFEVSNVRVTLAEMEGHVALGIFDIEQNYPNLPIPDSLGGKLRKLLFETLDAQFPRDQI
jgi:hypothetical protein